MTRRYEIHLANLDPTIGAEINKTRPVKKLDQIDKSDARRLRLLISEMYGKT